MTSYVFTVLEKKYYWDKVYQSLTNKYEDNFEMVLVLKKSNSEKEEVLKFSKTVDRVKVLLVDENFSENAMVGEAMQEVSGKDMVLCRDYFAYKTIFSDYMVAMGRQGAQVVVYRKVKKASKLKSFFSKLYEKVVKYIFGFKPYGGDIGLVYFNNIALSVLKELPNNTVLTKVNKWAGFEISYIDIEDKELTPAKLEKKELKPTLQKIIFYSVISVVLIAGFVLLAVFSKLSFVIGILIIFVLLLFQFFLFYNCLKYTVVNKYGDLRR